MRISKIKKPLCAAMAAITVAASLSVVGGVSASAAATSYNAWCDVNMDGRVDTNDALTLVDYINGDNGKYFAKSSCYDYNHDGVVDANDVIKLLNYLLFPSLYKIGINIADFNDDGKINSRDASYMYSNFDKLKNNFCYDFDGNRVVDDADIDYFIYHIILPDEYPLNIVTIKYDVPLYYQGPYGLCWAYSSVMISDYFNGKSTQPDELSGTGFLQLREEYREKYDDSEIYARELERAARRAFVNSASKRAIALAAYIPETYANYLSFGQEIKTYYSDYYKYVDYIDGLDVVELSKLYIDPINDKPTEKSGKGAIRADGCPWSHGDGITPKVDENNDPIEIQIKGSEDGDCDIYDLAEMLSNYGPMYLDYSGCVGHEGHAVVLTGVDVANNIVYTNNPHGIAVGQPFEKFMNTYSSIGDNSRTFGSIFANPADPNATPKWDLSNRAEEIYNSIADSKEWLASFDVEIDGILNYGLASRIYDYIVNNPDCTGYSVRVAKSNEGQYIFPELLAIDADFISFICDFDGDGTFTKDDFVYLYQNFSEVNSMYRSVAKVDYSYVDYYSIEAKCKHEMKHIPAKASTCSTRGNIDYYECSKCKMLFSDISGNDVIIYAEVLLPFAEHDYVFGFDDGGHGMFCKACSEKSEYAPHIPNIPYATATQDQVCTECGYLIIKKYNI